MNSLEEVGQEADTLRTELEQLYVRGLASSSAADWKKLASLAEQWERIGAGHIASRLMAALRAAETGTKDAPRALLSAHTSLHVFERVLSLEAAAESWAAYVAARSEEEAVDAAPAASPPAVKPPAAAPPIEDPKGALALLEELSRAVEDLVRTGVPVATEATRAKIDASFKEASRRKFLRLGPSLRYVNDDVGRYLAGDPQFSMRRFSFFLHRSWLLARGMVKAIRDKNDVLFAALAAAPPAAPRPFKSIEVVTLGVLKRTVASAYTFEFKLRIVGAAEPELVGRSVTYSLVFARKTEGKAKDLPAEAYLHLSQPQKFMPRVFRQGKAVKITDGALMLDERGGGRLALGPKSTVTEGPAHTDWPPLFQFDPAAALERVKRHTPGPLDLAVELQEEVVVAGATMSEKPIKTGDGRRIFALRGADGLSFDAVIPDGPDGEELLPRLRAGLKQADKPLLYGITYYEFGRMMLLPLSLLSTGSEAPEPEPAPKAPKKKGSKSEGKAPVKKDGGPEHLMLSDKTFDVSALVGNLF
ncbi:hypothetical protein BO221_06775 [Archangium sp. Cb G35]|uniref:hypothetical protein n=1 Tax=Archangium sp. Cb G35 TaxID=1920190 RepID=UPI000935E0F8|nr:hypothetical protein [Archangium sp. Cb G35]OJT25570.1 hypothetical protein BO221_06775 [Archangium sp. Cb G35]